MTKMHPDGRPEWAGLSHHEHAMAIDACDRILASHKRLTDIAAEIKRGADELRALSTKAAGRS